VTNVSTFPGARIRLGESDFHTFAAHAAFAELRRTDPVHLYRPLDTWIVTKYADIRAASRDSDHYSVAKGIDVSSIRLGELSANSSSASPASSRPHLPNEWSASCAPGGIAPRWCSMPQAEPRTEST
jgi:hypothetical protein